MAKICFKDVTRHFSGAAEPAVAGVDLQVADGEVVAFVGPTGAGKTTLLRLAGGLEVPDSGRVLLGDSEDVDDAIEVVLLFQNYAIYPNLSVRENIASPLRLRPTPGDVDTSIDEVVALLGLGELTRRQASELSTSERMRVALARSLVRRPGVLLLDEPLANLEPGIRRELRDRFIAAQHAFHVTTLYATEDPEEATAVADRIVSLEDGRLRDTRLGR
jgi:ABC-type sugar transport system ATPase subunit